MNNSTSNIVVSQVNITDIIKASENVVASQAVITSAVNFIKSITNKSDEIAKSVNKLQIIEKMAFKYNTIITTILDALFTNVNGKQQDLIQVLGRTVTADPKDSKKTIEKWTMVDAVQKIPEVINTVFKSIDAAAEFKGGFAKMNKLKKNIGNLKFGLTEIFTLIFETFSDLSKTIDVNKLLTFLVNDPDTITEIINSDTGDKSQSLENKEIKDVWDRSKTITKTQKGRMGLLDAVEKIFSIVGLMNSLKTPSMTKFAFQLIKLDEQLNWLFSFMYSIMNKNINPKTSESFLQLSLAISGDGDKNIGLYDIFTGVSMLIKTVEKLKLNFAVFHMVNMGFNRLTSLTDKIYDFANNESTKLLISQSTMEKFDNIAKSFKKILSIFDISNEELQSIILLGKFRKQLINSVSAVNEIIGILIEIDKKEIPESFQTLDSVSDTVEKIINIQKSLVASSALSLLAVVALGPVRLFISRLPKIIDTIIKAFEKIKALPTNQMRDSLKVVSSIIESIKDIQKNILKLALLAAPAAVALIVARIFLGALILFVNGLRRLSISLHKLSKGAQKDIRKVESLILSIVLICGSIIALALIIPYAITAMVTMAIPFMVLLLGFIGMMRLTLFIVEKLAKGATLSSVKIAVYMTIIAGTFILTGLAILMASLVGAVMRKENAIGNIIFGIIGMTLMTLVIIGLGMALSLATPFIVIAEISLAQIAILMGILTAVGLSIIAISKFQFSFGSFKAGRDAKSGSFGTGTGAAGNVGLMFEFVKFIAAQIGNGYTRKERKSVRKAKKMMRQVSKTVKHIVDIAESLKSLEKLELDTTTITTNVTSLFGFINTLEGEIATFLNKDKTNPEEIIDAAKLKKKAFKKSKKALSKVEAVVAMLGGMAESMMILKDFKFEDQKTGKNGENILSTEDQIKNNVTKLFKLINSVATSISNNKLNISDSYLEKVTLLAESIGVINDSFTGLASADTAKLEKNIGSYGAFIDKINTVEVTKLENATNMFKQMASFSTSIKGDFKELATSLSDKLLPVLEELKEVMSKVPEKIDQSSQNISASVNAANSPVNRRNVERQVKAENPELTKEEIKKEVDTRMNERAQADSNGIAAKIDELISLFKGYSGETAIVKTV